MSAEAITSIMERMCTVHEQLLELGREKAQAIIKNNVDAITQITSKENKLMKQVAELEQERIDSIRAFMQHKGIAFHDGLTMNDLLKVVFNLKEKQSLQDVQQRLLGIIDALQHQNEQNRHLIEQALNFINYSLDLMVGGDEGPGYGHPQTEGTPRGLRNGYFDTRA